MDGQDQESVEDEEDVDDTSRSKVIGIDGQRSGVSRAGTGIT